jgi:hypothetical protein
MSVLLVRYSQVWMSSCGEPAVRAERIVADLLAMDSRSIHETSPPVQGARQEGGCARSIGALHKENVRFVMLVHMCR